MFFKLNVSRMKTSFSEHSYAVWIVVLTIGNELINMKCICGCVHKGLHCIYDYALATFAGIQEISKSIIIRIVWSIKWIIDISPKRYQSNCLIIFNNGVANYIDVLLINRYLFCDIFRRMEFSGN